MCYFNGNKVTREEYIRLKHFELEVAKYTFLNRDVVDGFDFGKTAILRPTADQSSIELVELEWGFIPDALQWPFWETREQVFIGRRPHKDPRGNFVDGLNFLNAIGEEVLLKNKVYRKAALDRHCLFLSSGFYEWRHIYLKNKRTGEPKKVAEKFPYRVGLKNREYFWIAGIWQTWADADTGEIVDTCSLLTTAANVVMEQIHNAKKRQPTMLTDELAYEWILGNPTEDRIKELATYQMPWEELSFYTLDKKFKGSIEPLKEHVYPEVPPIILPGQAPEPSIEQLQLF